MTDLNLDMDNFFYFDEGNISLDDLNKMDLAIALLQPTRSFFYNRLDDCGITGSENMPNGLTLQLMTKYNITKWVGKHNGEVSDGSDGNPDRRILVSQNTIVINQSNDNIDVNVNFASMGNLVITPQSLSIPLKM